MKERRKRILYYVLGTIFLGFLVLTTLVLLFPNSWLDREFSEEVQEHQYVWLDTLMRVISMPGNLPYSIIMVLAVSAVFLRYQRKRESLFLIFTFVSGIISHVLKIIIDRPRPTDGVVRIIEIAKHQSFPSGHVLFYVVFFGFVIVLMRHLKFIRRQARITIASISMFFIFSIPFSRIYLGAHWFTDVLGGFLLGILVLSALSYLYLRKPNPSEL